MTAQITFGSVCSGIEAASVAWNPLGWEAAWLAEIEPFPCAVLAHHYPQVPNLGDMTKIAVMVRDAVVAAPDVFCGGTPCQAFSVAGLRNSLDDARGNLSLTFCEIANEIDTRRAADGLLPSIVFWENVPGVLNTKDNAFGCFLAGLAGEDDPLVAPGGKWPNAGVVVGPQRAIAWRVLDAQYFGVAQRRRRVFVVASARNGFDPAEVLFEFDGVRRDSAPSREAGQDVAGTISARTSGGGGLGTDFELGGGYNQFNVDVCPTLRAGGNKTGGDRPPGTDVDTADSLIVQSVALRGREGGATAELGGDVAGTLRASGGGGDKAHVLAPISFDCKASGMSGFGVGEIASTMRGQPIVAAFAENSRAEIRLEGGDGSRTGALSTGGGKPGQGMPMALVGMAVRRLTPKECARLQGFPDDYLSQVVVRGKPAADGPMYKALGNSWAVPNVRWIGVRIAAQLQDSTVSISIPA